MSRIALDSNILVYLAGVSQNARNDAKIVAVRTMLDRLIDIATLIAPVQALGELFVVLRRSGLGAHEARGLLHDFSETFGTSASEKRTIVAAADLVVDHKLQFWDALIVNAAVEAGCTFLLSEDMQHGFITRGLTIVNPLADPPHPRLAALLDAAAG